MAKTSPSKIVIDLTKCNKMACIFERTKKQNKVDPLNGLVIYRKSSIFQKLYSIDY